MSSSNANKLQPGLNRVSYLGAGVLFGFGLSISGMTNPQKILGFLDLFGDWDPSLIFVMLGALLVTVPGYKLVLKMPQPILESRFFLPTKKDVDSRLVIGSALFGIGWGIAGFCPGPALVAVITIDGSVLVFVAALLVGMITHHLAFE